MAEKILFVFEGEKTEHVLTKNLIGNYIQSEDNTVVKVSFCGEIYQLYRQMITDDFGIEYVDVFPFLQERDKSLSQYERKDFSQIYLFFDYDPHATDANAENLMSMLSVFNQETEKGKLFVSYPMVESLRCFNGNKQDFFDLKVLLSDVSSFKSYVQGYAHKVYNDVPKWNKNLWKEVIELHCEKAERLIRNELCYPESVIDQDSILTKQVETESQHNAVIVLNAFPLMLWYHFGMKLPDILIR